MILYFVYYNINKLIFKHIYNIFNNIMYNLLIIYTFYTMINSDIMNNTLTNYSNYTSNIILLCFVIIIIFTLYFLINHFQCCCCCCCYNKKKSYTRL